MLKVGIALASCFSFFALARPAENPLDLGKQAYESGRYVRAVEALGTAIAESNDPETKARASYYQALSLFELGLNYSSYSAFRNAFLNPKNSPELMEKSIRNAVIVADKMDLMERLGKVLERLPKDAIPGRVAAPASYAIGTSQVLAGDYGRAENNLKSVNPESEFFAKAQFFLGVIATKSKNYKDAIFYFRRAAQVATGKKDLAPLGELARLNLARSVYSSGALDKSIAYYSQFMNSSPYWLTVLLEASWPLLRVNDTTVSLGNLHTVLSPFYRENLVGEAYILRSTILFSLCKYEEMRQTISQFFAVYDPVISQMEKDKQTYIGPDSFIGAYRDKKLSRSFLGFTKRDPGVQRKLQVLEALKVERTRLARISRSETVKGLIAGIEEAERSTSLELGSMLEKLHKQKLAELLEQREQANYFKVEIVTGEKELIEGQKGLPPRRITDVETTVAPSYRFWPFRGEYWEDEMGAYVYTVESACQ